MLKNRIKWTVSVLATAMALSACQPKQKEPEQPQAASAAVVENDALKLKGDTEKLALNLPECDGNSCPEVSVERLSTNQPFIDELIDREILKQLNQILDVAPEEAVKAEQRTAASESLPASQAEAKMPLPKQQLEQQLKPFVAALLSMDSELKQLSSSHQISVMVKPKILNSEGALVTVVLNSSSYLGGAHGSSAQQYYNFDLEKKKLIPLSQVLQAGKQPALDRLAHEAFKIWVVDSKLAGSVDEYEQAWKFKLSENYYLGKDGLILQYAEYEIGPYVVGLPRLTIPYSQLQGILKKEYLPASEQPASEPKIEKAQS